MPKPSVVPAAGIEPASTAYETAALPLSYAGVISLELEAGLAPAPARLQGGSSALSYSSVEPPPGIGPGPRTYQVRVLPLYDGGQVVGTAGYDPTSPACHAGGLPLTYAPLNGGRDGENRTRDFLHPKQAGYHSPTSRKDGGTSGSRTPSKWATTTCANPSHSGPVVRPEGVEPSFLAYQASGLPLTYGREVWRAQRDSHPRSPRWQRGVLATTPCALEPAEGIGPSPPRWERGGLPLTHAGMKAGCHGRSRTCSILVQSEGSVPIQSAWQWWSREESNLSSRRHLLYRQAQLPRCRETEDWWTRGELHSHFLLARQESCC